ncbi:glyoxal oxidase-related protein [Wolffia australiana]
MAPFDLWLCFLAAAAAAAAAQQLPGTWEVLVENAGIASMHSAVTRLGTVVLLDRTDIGPSQLSLPPGRCRVDPTDRLLPKQDCYAHSVLFDPSSLEIRPLTVQTDTWCSSGQFLPDGTLLQTGGDLDGLRKIRTFRASSEPADWLELSSPELLAGRWYSTNQILPDGSVIIVGGRAAPTVEFYPPRPATPRAFPFLATAADPQMDNLYPYVHLLPDGHLFVFANTRAVLYDAASGAVLHEYPPLPGGPRNFPSAGSSAMLALSGDFSAAEVLVCGGAQYGAFVQRAADAPAGATCGRINAMATAPAWAVEAMPFPRIMGDMVMLPTGEVLIINGAMAGAQGFGLAQDPCLHPVLYRPTEPQGLRFMTLTPSEVPRMYHSTANLLPDGRVLVAGSNPHQFYSFDGPFPTELRLEAFSPEYLSPDRANLRPAVAAAPEKVRYGEKFQVEVTTELPVVGILEVNLASAPFATHSFSQGQRLVKLVVSPPAPAAELTSHRYTVACVAPPSGKVAPPGFYMAFVVNQGVPSVARWIQVLL